MTGFEWLCSSWRLLVALGALAALIGNAHGHQTSQAFLDLRAEGGSLAGRLDLPLRDLDYVLHLDRNDDREITWGEVRSRFGEIDTLVQEKLRLAVGAETLAWQIEDHLVDERASGMVLVIPWRATLASSAAVAVQYDLFFDVDPSHRVLATLWNGPAALTSMLTAEERSLTYDPQIAAPNFRRFVHEGVVHIWEGTDHIAFLLALLLPAVWRREGAGWRPAESLAGAGKSVLKIVTAFTVAHSITLAVATLGWVRLPSALVESVIATSVILAAANNLWPIWNDRAWPVAFGFGLIHGFGFASVLADLELGRASLARTLIGFNLGVELGQLAIVAVFLPLAFWLRASAGYKWIAVRFGSTAIAGVAFIWVIERVFNLSIF